MKIACTVFPSCGLLGVNSGASHHDAWLAACSYMDDYADDDEEHLGNIPTGRRRDTFAFEIASDTGDGDDPGHPTTKVLMAAISVKYQLDCRHGAAHGDS